MTISPTTSPRPDRSPHGQVSPLNPSLATDIVYNVTLANTRFHPHSGQIAVLNAVAMLQMRHAANRHAWPVSAAQVRLVTRLSESTVKRHLRWWAEHGVLQGGPSQYIVALLKSSPLP